MIVGRLSLRSPWPFDARSLGTDDFWSPSPEVARTFRSYFLRLLWSSRLLHRSRVVCSGLWLLRQPTMPSADFCTSSPHLAMRLASKREYRSPRVRRVTFTPCPPHIRPSVPDDFGLWVPMPPRPQIDASYTVRVPWAGALPAASFRSLLLKGTLAVRLEVPVIKASRFIVGIKFLRMC